MKTQKSYSNKLSVIMIWITTILLSLVFTTSLFSQNKWRNNNNKVRNQISELTQQQRKDLRKIIKEEFDNGAKRSVIREKVVTTLNKWGIKVPGNAKFYRLGMMNNFNDNSPVFLKDLTKDQRVELRKKMKELWISGATRKDIHNAAVKLLQGWGYDISKLKMNHPFRSKKFGKRMAFKTRMRSKHAKGKRHFANRRRMVNKMMKNHFRHNDFRTELYNKLNDNQKKELRKTVMEKRQNDRKELKEIVEKKLSGWGIKVPENFMDGNRSGFFGRLSNNMGNLSDAQRKEIRDIAIDMRKDNASRDEIRKAVQNKLKDFGTNSTDNDEDN